MNICLDKLLNFDKRKLKDIIKNNDSEILVLTTNFLYKKEQVDNLLFFDYIAKKCKDVVVIIDVNFEKYKVENTYIFDGSAIRNIFVEDCILGFVLRFCDTKLAFVFGDNIYKKSCRECIKNNNYKNIIHIDFYNEGCDFSDNFFEKNLNILSTFYQGKFILKK